VKNSDMTKDERKYLEEEERREKKRKKKNDIDGMKTLASGKWHQHPRERGTQKEEDDEGVGKVMSASKE